MNYKYKFCLMKAYFDKGYSLTNFVKYVIALFGLASLDVKTTMILALIYAPSCFILGLFWYKVGLREEEIEVNNTFNKFVGEMRNNLNITKNKKPR